MESFRNGFIRIVGGCSSKGGGNPCKCVFWEEKKGVLGIRWKEAK